MSAEPTRPGPGPRRAGPGRRLLVLGLGLGLGAAACGRPAVLDGERTEARIAESMEERVGVEVDRVTCPDDIAVDEGASFACRVELGDVEVEVEVEQTDGEGALELSPEQVVLVVERVEADIVDVLIDRFSRDAVVVACPGGPVRVEEPGATFECTATDGPQEVAVEVRVRDAHGALTYALP